MARPLKFLLYAVGALVVLFAVAAVSFVLLFDPNDFRDRIAEETRAATGRELSIEGDLEVSFFPWLAIGMGKTSLGNAAGFGDEPFASFESAKLSVRLLPLVFGGNVSIGTAQLDAFKLNLAVNRSGVGNWEDLLAAGEQTEPAETESGTDTALDIAGIDISNASITYSDAQSGDTYKLTDVNLVSGAVAAGQAIPLSAGLNFDIQPADLAGDAKLETTVTFDPDNQLVTFGDFDLELLGIDVTAAFEPVDYANEPVLKGTLQVDAFSLPSLMQRLNIEPPETVDPNALGKIIIDGSANITSEAIRLTDVELVVDDTTFTGFMSVTIDTSRITFKFAADQINLDGYMAPAADAGSASGDVPVEIPADLIRTLNLNGSLTVNEARLTGMVFESVDVKLRAANGDLRLHPMTANLFDGTYSGDVRINASGKTPVLSVNENVSDVNLGALAKAMFDTEQVTGTINGAFVLSGSGDTLAAIQQSLDGNLSFELQNGAFEGTDVWYELRRARALFKQEPAPEPVLPARTEFSNVRATGPVTDGIFRNDDLLAELPFMRLTGKGSVDLPKAEVDYRLTARVLEKPEFASGATEEELKEFTEAVIPVRITGPLASPSIKPDVEDMLKRELKKKAEEELLDRLFGGSDDETGDEELTEKQKKKKKKKKDKEDLLEDAIKDIFKD